jgi:nicotinamidase-related amidase
VRELPEDAWLVVIDAQRVFAHPTSPWGSVMWPGAVEPIRRLAAAFGDRVIFTRFVAHPEPTGSWVPYYTQWPFALVPDGDPLYAVVSELEGLARHTFTAHTFGKWNADLIAHTGPTPTLVLAGVSTDCCVISTALPAADAGALVLVAADACAGSSEEAHDNALYAMKLYEPMIELTTTDEVLAAIPGSG